MDLLVRERECDHDGFCLAVRMMVNGVDVGEYKIARTVGMTVNGFMIANLPQGVHKVLCFIPGFPILGCRF